MPAQNPLPRNRSLLLTSHKQIDNGNILRVKEPEQVLSPWDSHLGNFLTDFNSWFTIQLHKLVYASQCGLKLASDQVSSHTKAVYLMTLTIEIVQNRLGEGVGGYYRELGHIRHLVLLRYLSEDLSRLDGEVREIAGIQTNSYGLESELVQGHSNTHKVPNTRYRVISVHKGQKALGECLRERDECCKFPIIGVLSKFLTPLENHTNEINLLAGNIPTFQLFKTSKTSHI
mmetsp:Transcript_27828/g.44273  ORF Transcript_27828/g.44273 Transcript_27828/m.44273 type:complete len:230 (-) Transcript_27828:682-1371(-)